MQANQAQETKSESRPALIFCCSGAADVGEIAHQAARLLDDRGIASRFCLAGVAGRVEAHLRKTRQAPKVLAIDGCHVSCSRRTLTQAGFANIVHLHVGQVGYPKGKSAPTPERIERVADAMEVLLGLPDRLRECRRPRRD